MAQEADVEVLLARATLAYDKDQYDDALTSLNQALALDPENPRVLYYVGLTYLARKQTKRAIHSLEAARAHRPTDLFIRFQLGVAYFAHEQHDQAAPLLEEVYKERPQLDGLGYYVGFIRYRNEAYAEALEALRGAQSSDPRIQRLTRIYRGLALAAMKLPEDAAVALDEALIHEPPSPLTGAVRHLRNRLKAGKGIETEPKKRLRAQVSVGGFYDDNVAINPDKSDDAVVILPSQNLPGSIVEQLRSRDATSLGLLTSATLDYSWLRQESWEMTVNYSVLQTLNLSDGLSRFDIQDHAVGLNGLYRNQIKNLPYQLALGYTFDYLFLGQEGFLSRHTPMFSATVVEPNFQVPWLGTIGNLTTALVRYQVKEFFKEVGDDDPRFGEDIRDALNMMTGFSHAFLFEKNRHLVRIGYQYDNEDAEGVNFSYRGHRVLAGGMVTLPLGKTRLRYNYDVHFREYSDGTNDLFGLRAPDGAIVLIERDDTQQTHMVQLEKPLLYDLTLTAQYQRIMNRSSLAIYDYTKNMFSLVMTWTY